MLEYSKTILSKVSFDSMLFEKELKKLIKLLVREEVNMLREWCYHHYGHEYRPILNRSFVSFS